MTMKHNIEQEIDKTLNCLGVDQDIQVSPLFVDMVSQKAGHLRTRRGVGYQSKAYYPVVILLMVGLNLAVLAANYRSQESATGETDDQIGVIASEYGIGQNSYMDF